MDIIIGFLIGVGTVLSVFFGLCFFSRRTKFKVGDIIVDERCEKWDNPEYIYKITAIGDYSYKLETIQKLRHYNIDCLKFQDDYLYKVRK